MKQAKATTWEAGESAALVVLDRIRPRFQYAKVQIRIKEGRRMPVVRISFFPGRSVAQKREIAEVVADALARIAGSNRAGVHVIFDEISRENWVIGGAPEFRAKPGEE